MPQPQTKGTGPLMDMELWICALMALPLAFFLTGKLQGHHRIEALRREHEERLFENAMPEPAAR